MPDHTKVIAFPKQQFWTFYDVVIAGKNPVNEWLETLSEEARMIFQAMLKNHQKTESHLNWSNFKLLRGKPKEERIWQLDFIADRRQYRVLGVFGQGQKAAVIVLGCYHKGDVYTPQNALDTATKRAKSLREGKAQTNERKITAD